MAEDYTQSAKRHWADGGRLAADDRIDNADQLFGFAAECALKHALVQHGEFRGDEHRTHINVLWHRMRSTRLYRQFPSLASLLAGPPCFDGWRVDQRYQATGSVSRETLEKHQQCARRLLGAVGLTRG